jgi:hypothetical protein
MRMENSQVASVRRANRARLLLLAGIATIAASSSCSRDSQTDAELQTVKAQWTTSIRALRSRQGQLEGYVRSLQEKLAADSSIWSVAMRRRLESALIGGEQGLANLEVQAERLPLEVAAASDRADALVDVRIRMAAYLSSQEQTFAAIRDDIALAEKGEPKTEAELLANEGEER